MKFSIHWVFFAGIIAALVGCVSRPPPVYGILHPNCSDVAVVENSAAGKRFLKDCFVLQAVNGRRVVLSMKPEFDPISLRCGRQTVELAFAGFKNGIGLFAIGAQAECVFEAVAGRHYVVRGEISDDIATLWIEDRETKQPATEKLRAGVTAQQQFDPVRTYP
jgi:hypothetical protein